MAFYGYGEAHRDSPYNGSYACHHECPVNKGHDWYHPNQRREDCDHYWPREKLCETCVYDGYYILDNGDIIQLPENMEWI